MLLVMLVVMSGGMSAVMFLETLVEVFLVMFVAPYGTILAALNGHQ